MINRTFPAMCLSLMLSSALADCGEVDLVGLDQQVAAILGENLSTLSAAAQQSTATAGDFGESGMQLQAQGLYEAALACYEVAESLSYGDFRWPYLAGLSMGELGQVDQSVHKFKAAIHAQPDYAPARVHLAELLRLLGDNQAAARSLRPLAAATEDPGVIGAVGELALAMGDYDTAISWLGRALELVPAANRLHFLLAQAYRAQGEEDSALEHLKNAGSVGVQPLDPILAQVTARIAGDVALVLRGRRAFAANDLDAARISFESALERNPTNVAARINLAVVHGKQGDTSTAISLLEQVLAKDPTSQSALFNLGSLHQQENPELSRAYYEQLIGTSSEDGDLHFRLGAVAAAMGDVDAAGQHLELARRDQGEFERASLALASLHEQTGQEPKAISLLKDTLLILPSSEAVNLELAQLLSMAVDQSLRDGNLALQLAQRVHKYQPTDRSARMIALAYAELDECDNARQWLAEAIALLGDGMDTRKAELQQFSRQLPGQGCRPG